jgi:DNA-directed RNA polymerase beta subunit
MDQGPPKDQVTPYKREIIGEFTLQAPAIKKGRDGVDYTIPAGPQTIVGAVSLDGYKLHDTAIVYDPKLISQETGKSIFLTEPLHLPQLAQARKQGLVKIHELHEQKVGEAIARVQAPKKKQAVGASIKR